MKSRFQYGCERERRRAKNYEQKLEKKISETKQHPRSQGLVLKLHRPLMTMSREDWADHMKHTYGKYCQRAFKGKFSCVRFETITNYSILHPSF